MKKMILAATALVAAAAATPAGAQSATAKAEASPRALAGARLIKPLQLEAVSDLNFGTIVMGSVVGDQTVSIDGAGNVTCGTDGGGLTCTDTSQATAAAASYKVRGTQGQVVAISVAQTDLTGSNGGTLAFTPSAPATLTLANSGSVGDDFNVGGSIVINSDTKDGVYEGEIDVQVSYE